MLNTQIHRDGFLIPKPPTVDQAICSVEQSCTDVTAVVDQIGPTPLLSRAIRKFVELPAVQQALEAAKPPMPLPTQDQVAARGMLYSQAKRDNPDLTVTEHLRTTWAEYLHTRSLTKPALRALDYSAYQALGRVLRRDGKVAVKEQLGGFDIPSKSDLVDEAVADDKGRRSPHYWTVRARARRDKGLG